MTVQGWEEVIEQSLTLITMADSKAWCEIVITLGVAAGVVRLMMTHSATMSNSQWHLGYASLAVMALGVLLARETITARGKLLEEQGPGILNFRRGHLGDDADFRQRATKATAADVAQEYQEYARIYFVILNRKYSYLMWCQRVSVAGWFLASLMVAFLLQELRKRRALGQLTIAEQISTASPAETNGSARTNRSDTSATQHRLVHGPHS